MSKEDKVESDTRDTEQNTPVRLSLNVSLEDIFRDLIDKLPPAVILDGFFKRLSNGEFKEMIEWIDENYELETWINELGFDRKEEIRNWLML